MATALYVFANGRTGSGNELWIAGADLGGPRLLKDINPGIGSADPDQFTPLPDGRLLFVANDGVHGRELWVTDGTASGTRMLYDIGSGDGTFGPENLTVLPGGQVLFTADNGATGRELWVTDGTTDGTRLLKDINAGAAGSGLSDITAVAGGRFVFSADDGIHGKEWWVTDGTGAGTHLLKDITPGSFRTDVSFSRVDGEGSLYVTAVPEIPYPGDFDAIYGEWKTDGTSEGTVKVSNREAINYGPLPQIDGDTWVFKDYYFGGGSPRNYIQALYTTDGTAEGTHIIKDRTGSPGAPSEVISLGNGLVVFPQVQQLWATDGTEAGTRKIADIENLWVGGNTFVAVDGKLLITNVVRNYDGTPDTSALWITDGTEAGTKQLTGYLPHNPASLPEDISVLQDGTLVFSAPSVNGGESLVWTVDPAAGTVVQQDGLHAWNGDITLGLLHPGAQPLPEEPGTPGTVTPAAAAHVFINAEGQHGRELWVADGEFGERRLLKDINPGLASSDPSDLVHLGGGKALFVANDDVHGRELWITDGTEAGTRMLRDIGTGDGTFGPTNLVASGDGRVFFTADDGIHGAELWVTDGTWAGTGRLTDGVAGAGSASPDAVVSMGNGHLLFTALGADGAKDLWATDGTAAGTRIIRSVDAAEHLDFRDIDASHGGGTALVHTNQGTFATDGTAEGTTGLTNRSVAIDYQAVEGGRWVFADYDRTHIYEFEKSLFSTDGTATGTIKLLSPQEQTIGGKSSGETKMVELGNGQVIFQGARDLYVTDGTKEGTHVIGDNILTWHFATDFVSLGDGRALFMNLDEVSPSTPAAAADLWVTDGTAKGTFRIADSQSWNAGSLPDSVNVLADGSVVFSAASLDGNPNAVWHASMWAGGLHRVEDVTNWAGEWQPTQVVGLQQDGVWA
jgi:ELWxxDGT repeat protein